MMEKCRIMPHGRLQKWVAEEQGYFTAEGLDYECVYDFSTEVDVHAFGPGERLVFVPYTPAIFEHTHR